jgi:class 3 adenylate cyclase/tetratricopeptide (TPR) repeat protein
LNYKPDPVDTSSLKLTPEILELTEQLARNGHDIWARQRLSDGWIYGPERNDHRKEHPSLVHYDELQDSEKEYDRQTALEAIKMLLALGYTIESPNCNRMSAAGTVSIADCQPVDASPLLAIASAPLSEMFQIWSRRDDALWSRSPEMFVALGERMLHTGNPLFAYDVTSEGLKHFPGHVRLRQLLGLALARTHAIAAANEVFLALYNEGHRDEETLGLLARTFKDLAGESRGDAEARLNLRKAFELYAAVYRDQRSYWTGINAATTALLTGEQDEARQLALDVRDLCLAQLTSVSPDQAYWLRATIGEAWLILRDFTQAQEWYRSAVESAPKRYGDIQSTRRNARMIMQYLQVDGRPIEDCLSIPPVVVFTGHMIDRSNRKEPRFPPHLEHSVKNALRALLTRHKVGFGYASAACGSDILFLETIYELKAEGCVVLPYEKSSFIVDSVDTVPGANWAERCDRVLEQATQVTVCSDRPMSDVGAANEFGNLMLRGLGIIRARQLDTQLIPVVVWDGKPGDGPGGTASMVREWTRLGFPVEQIQIAEQVREQIVVHCDPPRAPAKPTMPASPDDFVPCVQALLFADAHGFSKLKESQIPLFVEHFLGMVGELTNGSSYAPISKNTWGDGLYLVFENVRDAGLFALQLCDKIEQINWSRCGLGELKLRVGLHAGPVYSCLDPVTNRVNYVGAHVSRAARIEPVTPLGKVYASEPFAALAADEGVREFSCEYVGQVAMAKNFGTFPTFAVRRQLERDQTTSTW